MSLCRSLTATVALTFAAGTRTSTVDCTASDDEMLRYRQIICSSLSMSPTASVCACVTPHASRPRSRCRVSQLCGSRDRAAASRTRASSCETNYTGTSAKGDWPHQAVYMMDLLKALPSPLMAPCLNGTYGKETVQWLDTIQAALPPTSDKLGATFMWTWLVFQVQYYDQPRKPGARIESPATLGRKCWAFAYLSQFWEPGPLQRALAAAGLGLPAFVAEYAKAMPLTLGLCEKELHSCFVNATPVPATCPTKVLEFKAGFERENVLRDFIVNYPFN